MEIAITGANGLIGRSIISELDQTYFKVRALDLPDVDVSDYMQLREAVEGCDAILHFAWKDLISNVRNDRRDPINMRMADNVYCVASSFRNKPRLIIGSSNQAHGDDIVDSDGRIRPTTPNEPYLEYGFEKLEIEATGRDYAEEYEMDVICLRIGNVNEADAPKPTDDGRPQRWLSKHDLGSLVAKCLLAPKVPDRFQVVYGVSNGSPFDPVNPFGYVPRDSA